jgi:hypothetical protein
VREGQTTLDLFFRGCIYFESHGGERARPLYIYFFELVIILGLHGGARARPLNIYFFEVVIILGITLKKPALAEYASIKTVIEHLKQHDFISYLEKKIEFDDGVNHEMKHKAKRLGLIQDFPIQMLEACYVTGRDLDGQEGTPDDSDDHGETVMS